MSSAFAIICADFQGLSCVQGRASWYTAPFRVSLRGVRPRCVGLARKISARCNTGSYVFPFLFICIFILSCIITHVCYSAFPHEFMGMKWAIAPGEFFPLTSLVKKQLIYYLYMSKLIYPTCKTP